MMGWQWHQLDHMQIIRILLQTDNHASTSSLNQQCRRTEGSEFLRKSMLLILSFHFIPSSLHLNLWCAASKAFICTAVSSHSYPLCRLVTITSHSHNFTYTSGRSIYCMEKQVFKVIRHKTASLNHKDGSVVFVRLCQCASLSNRWFPGSTRLSIPSCVSIGTAVFAQLTAESPCLQWTTFLLKNAASRGGSGPHLTYGSLGSTSPHPKWHLDRFSRFCMAHDCDRPTDQRPR